MAVPSKIAELVERFQQNAAVYQSEHYNHDLTPVGGGNTHVSQHQAALQF